ncbi:hypothetical protein [Streptomyces exfoliatus]|uniref:hypothetical protein n=1 Tax=Streptomyces exfoliatus TaxID=1905 RepID=UPI0004C63CAC|nr:hypothetical protein [Streptomyces exfoliatus]
MLQNFLASVSAVPVIALVLVLARPLRLVTLLSGFLAALRGTRGQSRGQMFDAFARHLTDHPARRHRR